MKRISSSGPTVRPDFPRPFRTPGYPIVPAIYLAGTGLLTAAVFNEPPVVSWISLPSIAVGVPVEWRGGPRVSQRTLKRPSESVRLCPSIVGLR